MRLSRVSKNTLYLFISQVHNKLIAGIFFIFAARFLGAEVFGKYILVITFISFSYILSDCGLSTLTIRDIARTPEKTREYLIHTLALRAGLAVIAYFLLMGAVLALAYPKEIIILVMIAGVSIITNNILWAFNAVLSAYEKMHIPSIMGVIFSTVNFLLWILCLLFGLGLSALVITIVFTGFLNAVLTGWLLRKFLTPFKLAIDYKHYKRLLKQAFPYAILSILSIIYFRVDTVMLSKLKTMESVGLYNAAYKFVEFLMFIPVSLMGAYFPKMSKQAIGEASELKKSYLVTTKFLLILIIPVAIIITIFGDNIVVLLFGNSFAPAGPVLKILIWAVVVMYLNAPLGNILYNTDKLRKYVPYAILNTSLNIILNLIFIPRWGILGAGFTTLLTEITGSISQFWFVRHILFKR